MSTTRRTATQLFVLTIHFMLTATPASSVAMRRDPVNEICLHSICTAVSGNCESTNALCVGRDVCGPFAIGNLYWQDGGRLDTSSPSTEVDAAYVRCANDKYCSARTVVAYIAKYINAQDCNGDGIQDCRDYFHLHVIGLNCSGPVREGFLGLLAKFEKTYKMFSVA